MIKFLFGENNFASWQKYNNLKTSYLKSNTNIQIVDGEKEKSIDKIFNSSQTIGMFQDKSVTFVKRVFQSRSKSFKERVAKELKDFDGDIVFWEDGNVDKRTKLYKAIKNNGDVKEYKKLKSNELLKWVDEYISKSNINIRRDVAEKIVMRVGDDQFSLKNTLDKLILYAKSIDKDKISDSIVKDITEKSREESVWDFIDQLSSGDKRALITLENLMSDKSDYAKILGLIVRQLKILYLVKINLGKRLNDISSLIGVHTFIVKKAYNAVSNLSVERLERAYDRMSNLDFKIKTGQVDPKLGLDLFILTF